MLQAPLPFLPPGLYLCFRELMQGEGVVANSTRGWLDLTHDLPALVSGHAPLSN